MKVEPGNILKLFLNFSNFEPQYSYRLYSYKKKECIQNHVLFHRYFVPPHENITSNLVFLLGGASFFLFS